MSTAENTLEQLRARVGAVPLALRLLLFLPTVGLTFYWVATGSGLYAFIAEATVRHADLHAAFYPRAAVFTLGVLLLPVFVGLVLLGKRYAR